MNFGEALAHWYFRLNGFFPLPNFVLHRVRNEATPDVPIEQPGRRRRPKQNADADILALRLPHVFENIGGQGTDWDRRLNEWELGIEANTVCVICEVKTGAYKKIDINNAFGQERLKYAIGRFGSINRDLIPEVAQQLSGERLVR